MSSLLACILAMFGICAVTVLAGRMAGLAATALSGALIAYFVMPPVFSFRIERQKDLAILNVYCVAGLVVTRTVRRASRGRNLAGRMARGPRASAVSELAIREAITWAIGSDPRFRTVDFRPVPFDPPREICHAQRAIARVVAEVLQIAFERSGEARRVSIYSARESGAERVWIIAQYAADPALPYSLNTGRDDAQPLFQVTWPAQFAVTHFDNGVEHVYQIAIRKPARDEMVVRPL